MLVPKKYKTFKERYESQKVINRVACKNYARTIKGKYTTLKRSAKAKGIDLSLSFQEFVNVRKTEICSYCFGPLPEAGHGIDRIDNKQGYHIGNVRPSCAKCNTRKGYLEAAGFSPKRVQELMDELWHTN